MFLVNHFLNLIGYVKAAAVEPCEDSQEMCFSQWTNASATFYTDRSLSNYAVLSWPYQYCTQWGCLPTGSVPEELDRLPLVSRLIDDDYNRLICKHAFDIDTQPDLDSVLAWGGHNLTYPRLAHVGGQVDNWLPLSPFADLDPEEDLGQTGTTSQPMILIEGAGHGWDFFGVPESEHTSDYPPASILSAQAEIVRVVKAWVAEWEKPGETGGCAIAQPTSHS